MIHEFDPIIYPRKIWITYNATSDELNKKFPSGDYYGNKFVDENSYYGVTYRTSDRNNKGGILIRFCGKKEAMEPWNMVHEAIRAAGHIFSYIGVKADYDNDEAFAYLVAWIVKCCCRVKEGK